MTFHDPTQHPATGDEPLPGREGDEAQAEAPPALVEPLRDEAASPVPTYARTRLSGFWAAFAVCVAVLVILIVFVLENSQKVTISFFGAHGHLDAGIALLISAAFGALVIVFAGTARILQVRSRHRRRERARRRRSVHR
jgi:uncharacterized integral membrane protein